MEPGTIMDETNDRREARRRRILENSESRLRMITSRRNPGETEGKSRAFDARHYRVF